ncbi:hypothetical protein C8R42DRAFT_10918 [Lentinula raphanica]|nr:hypothetical protein C8R42DRAFT_10918 [Lentinula raphanica]
MNLRSSNDVGVSTWTVTIMFMDKPQLSVGSQMQSDAPPVFDNKLLLDSEDKSQFSGGSLTQSDARPVFQSVATALQQRLPESDTLFLLPHWGSIPCWNKHQKIEFHYFVQQGLPLKSGTRTEKEFGTGHVKKENDGVLRTTIDSDKSGTNRKKTQGLHTSSSSSSTSNEFYVVDSEMKRHDPFKDSYQWLLSVSFHLKGKTIADKGNVVHKDIVAKLRPYLTSLPEGILIYFPSNDRIPPWDKTRKIGFDLYLTPHDLRSSSLSLSGFKNLKKLGRGDIKQDSNSQITTNLHFEPTEPSKGTGDNFPVLYNLGKNNLMFDRQPNPGPGKNKGKGVEDVTPIEHEQSFSSADYHLPPPEFHGVTVKNVDQGYQEKAPTRNFGSTARDYTLEFPELSAPAQTNQLAATRSAPRVKPETAQGGGSTASLFRHSDDVTPKIDQVSQEKASIPPQKFASTARDYESKFPALGAQTGKTTATPPAPVKPETVVQGGGKMASSWSRTLTSASTPETYEFVETEFPTLSSTNKKNRGQKKS